MCLFTFFLLFLISGFLCEINDLSSALNGTPVRKQPRLTLIYSVGSLVFLFSPNHGYLLPHLAWSLIIIGILRSFLEDKSQPAITQRYIALADSSICLFILFSALGYLFYAVSICYL